VRQQRYWDYNAIFPWQHFFYSRLVVWDGSTREMWEEKPANLVAPCDCDDLPCKPYIDLKPKVGDAFGMIIPEQYYDDLIALYQASSGPQAFMTTMFQNYQTGVYPATFRAAALHIFGGFGLIYRIFQDCYVGPKMDQERRYCSGMILIDVKQNWFSESFGQS
jgi:hypothetical protein